MVSDRFTVIYFYDRCLTIAREVELVWCRRRGMSVATGFYILFHVSISLELCIDAIFIFALAGCQVRTSSLTWLRMQVIRLFSQR